MNKAKSDWKKHTGCTRKVRHDTKKEAETAASNLGRFSRKFRSYFCRHCEGWHLTSH